HGAVAPGAGTDGTDRRTPQPRPVDDAECLPGLGAEEREVPPRCFAAWNAERVGIETPCLEEEGLLVAIPGADPPPGGCLPRHVGGRVSRRAPAGFPATGVRPAERDRPPGPCQNARAR